MDSNEPKPSHQVFEQRLFAGGRSVLVSQAIRLAIRVVFTVALARMLSPDDYGLFGMALVVFGLFYGIRDVGLSTATVNREAIGHAELSALFWINVLVGCVLTVVFAALGPAIAAANHDHRLVEVIPVLGTCFLINACGAQHQAILGREMRFVAQSAIEVISMAAGLIAALVLAWLGSGYWALVLMMVSMEGVKLGCLWVACRWRPGRWPGLAGLRDMLIFGAGLTGFGILSYLAGNTDQFLVGVWMGSSSLGLYGRAAQFTCLPAHFLMGPLQGWMVAALSRLRLESGRYESLLRQVMNATAHVTMPLAAGLFAAPAPLIALALGSRWVGAAPALRWLAAGLLFQPLLFAQNWILMSRGRGAALCAVSIGGLAALVALCFACRGHGLRGMAFATFVSGALSNGLGLAWAVRSSPTSLTAILSSLARPFLLALLFGLALDRALACLGAVSNLHTGLACLAAGAAWAALGLMWKEARGEWLGAVATFGGSKGRLAAEPLL